MITIKKKQNVDELNLDGYKHVSKNNWDMPAQLIEYLENNDFKLIGEGGISKVFQSPTENFVVKVNKGYIEPNYEDFVNFSRKYSSDPHLPKFGKLRNIENKFYVVFIEKLDICEASNDIELKLCEFLIQVWKHLKNDPGRSVNEVFNLVKDWDENYNNSGCFKSQYADQYMSLTKTLKNMSRHVKAMNLDLFYKNLGIRPDGIIVLLDPVR